MSSQYYHANLDGTIEKDDPPKELVKDEKLQIIEEAFSSYGHSFNWINKEQQPYKAKIFVNHENKEVVFRVKTVSGGGRPDTIPREQRIQIPGEQLNELVDANVHGKIGLILGVYKRKGIAIIIAWRPINKQTGGNVSKQANIQMIADAMSYGFAQFEYPTGNGVVCAFRKEFMQYYLKNIEIFSEKIILDYHDIVGTNIVSEGTTEYNSSNEEMSFKTGFQSDFNRNRIVFGAPGTGKSYELKEDCKKLMVGTSGTYERVTFYPDYAYSHFVGTYKPVTEDGTADIKYEFVPGPFMRVYVEALKSGRESRPQPYLLLIEEINRAKVAAVFGDVFQLLDRDDDGVSEYEIYASEDVKKYLAKELGGSPDNYARIRIPDNMFIWATMNSADQGVFPMDTAFKRRWNFEYLGINKNDGAIKGKIKLGKGSYELEVEWNQLRKAINEKLAEDYKVNEDKLMGPYFLSKKIIKTISETDDTIVDSDKFISAFKNKVIMYLYEDAAKQYKNKLFDGCNGVKNFSTAKYSSVCDAFDEIGINIFGDGFREIYNKQGE
ncbi:AAA family ATPase [Clostridium tyrobutyricum]|uniref:AAA family ATPase n=1 Tax=Clostridium tyrobutyricum TaxID=1519 RepID=UPI00189CD6BB|nr:AAA family ATPase [Clostridium tyrobutyricum]